MLRALIQVIGILGLAALIFFAPYEFSDQSHYSREPLMVEGIEIATTTETIATSTDEKDDVVVAPVVPEDESTTLAPEPEPQNTTSEGLITRIQNPYPYASRSAEALESITRAALVNIHCVASGRTIGSISGSGVLIDPRGVILTNAHVAQYLLLDTDPRVGIACSIRTGSPARSHYTASILYLPEVWVKEHAKDVNVENAKGNGKNDFAVLVISGTIDGSPLPASFPYLPTDIRDAIAFKDDSVFLAGYPAEFGGISAHGDLYASSVFTKVGDLYTFDEDTVDLISLGGIVLAQGGSSGGATVNMWGHLVGIISTTSDGETTGARDLRAITLAYINRALEAQTGSTLAALLSGDIQSKTALFMTQKAPSLSEELVGAIQNR